MKAQAYQVFIPLEVGDIIQGDKYPNKYKLMDILHTYSAEKQTVVSVDLVLYDLVLKSTTTVPYDFANWKIVEYNESNKNI